MVQAPVATRLPVAHSRVLIDVATRGLRKRNTFASRRPERRPPLEMGSIRPPKNALGARQE